MRIQRGFYFLVFWTILIVVWPLAVSGQGPAIPAPRDIVRPVHGKQGMVAAQEAAATRIGLDILKRGGNAVDAAVAVGFALAVTLPRAGNLGGGGFMLIHQAAAGKTLAIDYRETAPAKAVRGLFLDPQGNVDEKKARFSHLSAGVPGTVAGLTLALASYGTLPLGEVMAPAIRLAREGFPVTPALADILSRHRNRLKAWPATKKIFFKLDDGSLYAPGDVLVQTDLARSLEQIAAQGAKAFYRGDIAGKIADDMQAHGGLITRKDLRSYRVKVRSPVHGTYRGYEILSMPPPSSGGVHLIQMLNILEGFPIREWGHNTARTLHHMAEAMKLAYADRSRHLGDPGFWKVPVEGLTSKAYAAQLRKKIDPNRARLAGEIQPGNPTPYESKETTHFSIVDREGNVVANTYTLNFSFGSGIVADGTGILLNNEMDDFSAKPGAPNAYGLIGGRANAIAPRKRPLSSMSPALVLKDGRPFLVTGSPGGSRIITTVLQVIMNVIDHGMDIAMATRAPRIHHQWLPDELRVETGLPPDALRLLKQWGHKIRVGEPMGAAQSIVKRPGGLSGASDPRREGALTLGY